MKYSAEEMSLAGDKYLGRSYSEMDCQRFIEKCMADVGYKRDLPGSNAWFRAMTWTGTPEECVRQFGQIPKGALLFILEQDGREPAKYRGDGIGNASHIGMKTGRGDGAIHSSSSRGCVATSTFKDRTVSNGGWNRVGLLNVFDYGTSVNWVLEHDSKQRPADEKTEKGDLRMGGTVTASKGSTVNLRKKPKQGSDLIDRIPVGSEVEIMGSEGDWYHVVTCGKVGWMMKQFVKTSGSQEDDDLPVAEDPQVEEDFSQDDLDEADPADAAALLAEIYAQLGEIRSRIEKAIGRG